MDAANLKVWLPFDESTTLDKCGNTWTTTGSVSLDTVITKFGVASVHLPSGAYLKADNVIDLNADKWTFDGWAYCVSSTDDDGFLALSEGANRRGIIAGNDGVWVAKASGGAWQASNTKLLFPSVKNQWVHLAIVKNGSAVTFYQDGIAVWSFETSGLNNNGVFILGGASYGYGNDIYFDEVRFYEGTALWTENFTPPTAEDYVELALTMGDTALLTKTFDVQRKLSSRVEFTADVQRKIQSTWRYVNAGTADTLITTGTTLNNLPESKSVTGTAFYQTTREKCFDLPETDEIWIKFDVYFNGSNRWRAYNGGTNSFTGITAQTNGDLSYFSNDTNVQQLTGICIANQRQTVLLHMISSSSSGVIEAWVDGTKIYRYTGDVNHGEDFADIYLQSDGSGTFFSNVVISNKQLTFGDGYTKLIADVQRKLSSRVEFTADVSRIVINGEKLSSTLKVWLPFDNSVTEDKCLNDWVVYGSATVPYQPPTITATNAISGNALQLNGSSYLRTENIELGGQDFSIDGWLYMNSTTPAQACIVLLEKELGCPLLTIGKGSNYPERLRIGVTPTSDVSTSPADSSYRSAITNVEIANKRVHFELDYQFNEQVLKFYINGVRSITLTNVARFERRNFTLTIGYFYRTWGSDESRDYYFKGYLDEFRIFDGLVLHTDDFTPPTVAEYTAVTLPPKEKTFFFDVQRKVNNTVTFAFDADIVIRDVLPVSSVVDVERRLTAQVEFSADIVIRDVFPFEFDADINRAIKGKVKLFAVDNTGYFPSGGTSSSGDSGTVLPVVIPPQETIPAAINNTIGLQSIEISLSEQQLTDNVAFTGVVPFDVMFPVQGQYLDYVFDMRVEHVTKKGVLYSCDCCIDIDQLLYTQIAYTVAPSTDWHTSGDSSTATTTSEVESVSAMYHALQLAAVLGKTPVIQFDDFQSTVLMENAGGVTYADMIRDIFGWSARVPTQMINVFVRNDKIFFVQRGHEARLIDLTLAKYTVPTVTHEIVRMTWGSTPWSKTETKETKSYRPPNTSTTSGNGAGIADIEENGGTAQVVHDEWFGQPESGYVNYTYNRKGLLIQSFTYVYNHETTQSTYTTVNHAYDTDGTLIYTGTFVQSMGVTHGSNYSSSNTEENKSYIKLPNGEKFLARESIVRYVGENSLTPTELAESKTIIHSPTRAGQSHTTIINDGETVGGIVGQNTGDDRVTPFSHYKAGSLSDSFKNSSGGAKTFDSIDDIESSGAYYFNRETGKWEKLNETVDTQSRTLNGLSLYDSTFPIHNVEKLVELTAAVQWLNRRTKETVNFTLYEYPHLIDFNDRIIFNGAEYFLVSNIATTNARVFNEQRISLVRWY